MKVSVNQPVAMVSVRVGSIIRLDCVVANISPGGNRITVKSKDGSNYYFNNSGVQINTSYSMYRLRTDIDAVQLEQRMLTRYLDSLNLIDNLPALHFSRYTPPDTVLQTLQQHQQQVADIINKLTTDPT